MSRTRRVKIDGNACYHLMSRTNNRQFLFAKGEIKDQMVAALKRAAYFSGIKVEAYCMMDDHFHIVCRVIRPQHVISEGEIIDRLAAIKGADFALKESEHWRELRGQGLGCIVDAKLDGYRRRMYDISEFIKTYKEIFNLWFKRDRKYVGSIWSGRFKSTLIEDGGYFRTCMRYVELNPVRAGMVRRMREYCWSSAKANEISTSVGPVPEGIPGERLMRRVVQIGEGRIFGSEAFVSAAIGRHQGCFHCATVRAQLVTGTAYSSHGYRLAIEKAA